MTIQVQFDPQVQEKAGGASGQTATAATVREALFQVARQHPSLRLFNCEGEMRSVYHVRQGDSVVSLDAPTREGEALTLSLG